MYMYKSHAHIHSCLYTFTCTCANSTQGIVLVSCLQLMPDAADSCGSIHVIVLCHDIHHNVTGYAKIGHMQ